MIYSLCLVLVCIGLYGVVTKKNIVKIVISLTIMEYGVNLFLILVGYRHDGVHPGMEQSESLAHFIAHSVDPLPQALVLMSIVISLGMLALMVGLCIRLYERYGTFDITEIRKLRG